ncbi:MAG TPA: hypothetical protein VGM87_11235 [Roseomonas sp.]|jgi:hypothetical protein
MIQRLPDETRQLNLIVYDPDRSRRMLTLLRMRRLGHRAEAPADTSFVLAVIGRGGVDALVVELRPGDTMVPALVEKLRALPPWAGAVATFGLTTDFTGKATAMAKAMALDGMILHDQDDAALDAALRDAVKARLGTPALDPDRYENRPAADIGRDREALDALAARIMPLREEASDSTISMTASALADDLESLGLPVAAHAARLLAERPVAGGVLFMSLASAVIAARTLLRYEHGAAQRREAPVEPAAPDTI